jgi:hypothetical protein
MNPFNRVCEIEIEKLIIRNPQSAIRNYRSASAG